MTNQPKGQHPLEIRAVEYEPLGRDKISLQVNGRWDDRRQIPPGRAQLVIRIDGMLNRFPVAPAQPGLLRPGEWHASFALPSWVEPHLKGRVLLELGFELIELPEPRRAHPATAPRASADAAAQLAARIRYLERSLADARQEPSRLREQLGRTQAELDARVAQSERLKSARSDLLDEISQLRAALEHERARSGELDSRLATATQRASALRNELAEAAVGKEAARREAAALRDELERVGAELATVRERTRRGSAVDQARSVLAEARSTESLNDGS